MNWQIVLGYFLIVMGVVFSFSGITIELGKKMENHTGEKINSKTFRYYNGAEINGKEVEEIKLLVVGEPKMKGK